MFTSNFARMKKIEAPLEPVAISRGIPTWFKGRRELILAPTWAMLQAGWTMQEFAERFRERLDKLDPGEVVERLTDNAVLLCWERPAVKCHRRIVADWLHDTLGLVVPELHLGTVARFDVLPDAK